MAILANRIKTKNFFIELSKFTYYSFKKLFVILLILSSSSLLYFSCPKIITNTMLETVGKTLAVSNVIYSSTVDFSKSIYERLIYFRNLEAENIQLKLKNESLRQIKNSENTLRAENIELKKMLNVPREIHKSFITAKVVGTSISPFSASAIIQAGSNEGVKVNDIVKGKEGLIGRVVEVSPNYSTVMLVTDHNSRIPVFAGNSESRGILAKQNNDLKIIYLEKSHNLKVGETIYTSGDGKIFSSGIAVAVIVKITDKEVFVETIEKFNGFGFVFVESDYQPNQSENLDNKNG